MEFRKRHNRHNGLLHAPTCYRLATGKLVQWNSAFTAVIIWYSQSNDNNIGGPCLWCCLWNFF